MELYLIRHGETVDNVAGLYAGVRDSALTNHGVAQTECLGAFFAQENVIFTHIFASPLSRAYKTAQALQAAQPMVEDGEAVEIVQVPDLIERDFGSYEGKTIRARAEAKKLGRDAHGGEHSNEPGFVDVESKESMNKRADDFLDQHLLPLFGQERVGGRCKVAIVSHGILLSHLWRRFLLRLPAKSVTISPELTTAKGSIVLQHLGGWGNTGYLELKLTKVEEPSLEERERLSNSVESAVAARTTQEAPKTVHETDLQPGSVMQPGHASPNILAGWTLLITAIDHRDHLVGLKRQRGGIGRSAHDGGQRKLDGFFKRQRTS
jgi:broad specificity phosphatase PhoE